MKNFIGILDLKTEKTHKFIRYWENSIDGNKGNTFYIFSDNVEYSDIQLSNAIFNKEIELIFEDKEYEELKNGLQKAIELLKDSSEFAFDENCKKEVLKLEYLLKEKGTP